MKVDGKLYRTIWEKDDNSGIIQIIDQRFLPHRLKIEELKTVDDICIAIKDMHVRGAPLIGVTAAYGIYFACIEASLTHDFDESLENSIGKLISTRPTAVNLQWAVDEQLKIIDKFGAANEKINAALINARLIAENDISSCKKIGENGFGLIEDISKKKNGNVVNILTHCNAGWLATVDYGTATAPIFLAFERGIKLHVWVDETRPRNQGARLTAWELANEGIPHTVIADNTGGYLMQKGMVDMVITGSDRTARNGDVANKIGTYLKALAAYDNNIPFYVALPSSTIDLNLFDGIADIPIEERNPYEVRFVEGLYNGEMISVLIPPEKSPAANYAFDVTPARLVTGLITEKGIIKANRAEIEHLFKL